MMLGQLLPAEVFAYMLVLTRMAAAVMLLPGIGEAYVPTRVRMALALALSAVIFPLVRPLLPEMPSQAGLLATLLIGEIVHGVVIGGVARLLLSGLHVAGTVIAFQSSLAYAQTVDPNQGTQGALLSALFMFMGVVLIYATGLHGVLIMAMYDSYTLFPAGTAPPASDYAQLVLRLVAGSFDIGMRMAAPFIVYGLVFYIGLGLLQRLIPQVQLFFIAMPAQLLLAFVVLMAVIGATLMTFLNYFEATVTQLLRPV